MIVAKLKDTICQVHAKIFDFYSYLDMIHVTIHNEGTYICTYFSVKSK